ILIVYAGDDVHPREFDEFAQLIASVFGLECTFDGIELKFQQVDHGVAVGGGEGVELIGEADTGDQTVVRVDGNGETGAVQQIKWVVLQRGIFGAGCDGGGLDIGGWAQFQHGVVVQGAVGNIAPDHDL